MAASKHERRRPRPEGFARFFTKQLLLFVACALLVIVVDLALYIVIAFQESNANFNTGSPASLVRTVDEQLARTDDGTFSLEEEASLQLASKGAWGLLVDESGTAIWSQNLPADVPRSYSLNDIAIASHYAAIADYPAFFWDRSDGLLIVGLPKGEFWTMSLTYPASTMRNLPLYILTIFAVDVGILFLLYALSRRRTQNAVGPIADALDKLSEGKSAQVDLKGDLQGIGRQITETSALIEQKDAARANWIRGVSHDIRTPLSMILGYADGIAQDEEAPDDARARARIIRAQGLRIKDLVTDLNTASLLDYAAQPLNLEHVRLSKLLRTVIAAHMNAQLDDAHPVDLHVDERAADATVLGDERLLTRVVENALANARLHNEAGCRIRVSLALLNREANCAVICIADDGAGVTRDELAALEARLARSRTARSAAGSYGEEHGLGLALADRIVRAHGGSLSLESEPAHGFTVKLMLPITEPKAGSAT